MMHAILKLSSSSSDKVNALSGIFQRCCADGCLNQHIINTLIDETSAEEFSTITGGLEGNENAVEISNLPPQWSFNSRAIA